MNRRTLGLLTFCAAVIWGCGSWHVNAQDASLQAKLIGKWIQHTPATKGEATMTITSVDSTTGQLKGKWIPPTGEAAGKEFDIIGWVSSAPARPNQDNAVVLSFSVSLSTYGSITNWTGYLKDNKIIAMWHNIRPNANYEWSHITANQDIFTRNQ